MVSGPEFRKILFLDCFRKNWCHGKGTGFEQPLQAHQHWHVDVSLHQPVRHLLLPVQRSEWVQLFPLASGSA
jgi:hypothetical protein